MNALVKALSGKKTYLVSAAIIAYQLFGHYYYGQPLDVQAILAALGLSALRAGVTKSGPGAQAILVFALVAGTASPASAADLLDKIVGGAVMKDLQQASTNLQNAIANQDLAPDDAAATCLASVVGAATPKPDAKPYTVNGVASLGSVLYIDAHKVGKIQAAADTGCRQIIGQFVIDGVKAISPLRLPGN